MTNKSIMKIGEKYTFNTYGRLPVAIVKGEGTYVFDADGKRYLDFVGGIAVTALGHVHPKITATIQEQARKILHCSNLYWIEPQVKLAKILVENSCLDRAFFCNSGAEANEGAIKLARKYSKEKFSEGRYEIITANQSFHGRTLVTLAATGQERLHAGFRPMPSGFTYVPFGDLTSLKKAINPKTCAIMLEPIQGEGGINIPTKAYMQEVAKLCKEQDLLLMLDEIQVGIGRTGTLFAYEQFDIEPDIMTLAKALGSGVPIGAILAKEHVAVAFKPGDHGSTFGGNPLATAAGNAVMEVILENDLLAQVVAKGVYLQGRLLGLKEKYDFIKEVRGMGMIWGMELDRPGANLVSKCLEEGLLINCTDNTVLRLLPPLTTSIEEINQAIEILDKVLGNV